MGNQGHLESTTRGPTIWARGRASTAPFNKWTIGSKSAHVLNPSANFYAYRRLN